MNIDFTEVDNLSNNNYFNVNTYESNDKYWENEKNQQLQAPKKKKVSYDDILNSLNLVVNKNGVLQYMSVNPSGDNTEQQYNQQQVTKGKPLEPQYNQQQVTKGKPLEPQVKNSFIFNKYFKDYKDPNAEVVQEVKVPQTIEEYNKMVLEERIKRIQERNRIAQIKSTKMLFENNNNNANVNASKNNLRMMKFG
jgi:hypothetical protein